MEEAYFKLFNALTAIEEELDFLKGYIRLMQRIAEELYIGEGED